MPFFIIKQEFIINIKNLGNLMQSLIFLLITTSIFAITTSNDNPTIAFAIIWICLVFAILLACNQLQRDFDDGTFEQLYLSGYIFELIILVKIISNWLFAALPLIIILPIVAIFLKIPSDLILNLFLVALLSSFLISFLANFGSSLILSAKSNSALLSILVLPLLIPVVIFSNCALGQEPLVPIKLLLAITIFLLPVLTFATAASVRIHLID